MTLLLIEGFDHINSIVQKGWQQALSGQFWGDSASYPASPRVGSGQSWQWRIEDEAYPYGNDQWNMFKLLQTPATEVIFGVAHYRDANSNKGNSGISGVGDINANFIGAVNWDDLNRPYIVKGDGSTVATCPFEHVNGTWAYYELRIKVAGAAGECELYVNGGPMIPTTVANFGTTPIQSLRLYLHRGNQGDYNSHRYMTIDDVYILDTTGPSPRNSFLGDIRVETIYPMADGAHHDWVPLSGGANYAMVDEHPGDDADGTYVSSNTPGAQDTYVCTDLASSGVVYAVQCNIIARKTTAGFKQIRPLVRRAGADYPGAVKTLATSYNWYNHVYPTDPAGGEWSTVKVNGAEFGMEVVT